MRIAFNLFYLFLSCISLLAGIFTLTGELQKVIKFTDPLSEIIFCVFSFLLFMFSVAVSVEIKNKK